MTNILDQIEEMNKIDKSNMLNICIKTPAYCRDAIHRANQSKIPRELEISDDVVIKYKRPKHIIIVGMGGSAIGGEILRSWLREEVTTPLEVCREYTLPAYANKDTLVFAVSYSGNTQETLNAFVDAIRKGCITMVITSGGQLLHFAEKMRIPHVKIPSGMPPRTAIPYLFFPLPVLMKRIGVHIDLDEELCEAIEVLENLSKEIAPQNNTTNNPSKKLALELEGTIPVVYGYGQYEAVAHRFKTQFNENSKVPSIYAAFPELNHNEVVGWEAPDDFIQSFSVILLRERDELPFVRQRIETTKILALHRAKKVLEILARGKKRLAKMLSLQYIGDFASIYLAILMKTDPTPVETIERIKMEIDRKVKMVGLENRLQNIIRKRL